MNFDSLLYVVTTRVPRMGRDHFEVARLAIEGGATAIQFRDKEMDPPAFLETAYKISQLCKDNDVTFIVNDRLEAAVASGADGLHLGQSDQPAEEVRTLMGESFIVGVSVSTPEEAQAARLAGADYLGVGPIFQTPSKDDAPDPVGCGILRDIRKAVDVPLVAIGGLDASNAKEVIAAGADGIAVISALVYADDMTGETAKLRSIIEKARRKRVGVQDARC